MCCRNTAFTEQEVEALIKGVEAYQLSNWASILKYGLTWQPPVFCGRTDVHLKVVPALEAGLPKLVRHFASGSIEVCLQTCRRLGHPHWKWPKTWRPNLLVLRISGAT